MQTKTKNIFLKGVLIEEPTVSSLEQIIQFVKKL
jgi:hypothetical protein